MPNIIDWAKAGQKHEGYFPGSASYRNNNPGNFRCSSLVMGELGAIKCVNNLAVFPTFEKGFEALVTFLTYAATDKLKSYRGDMTLFQFYSVYAPSSDNNNPMNYASAVAKDLGITVDTKIKTFLSPQPAPVPIPPANSNNQKPMIFFGQRDPRWAGVKLGGSRRTVGTDGCTTTTISDAINFFFGSIKDPGFLAQTLGYTSEGYIIWETLDKVGLRLVKRSRFYDKVAILNGLKDPNTTVSLNVDGGRHWVFALKALPFDRYWVHDPWTNSKKIYGGVVGSAVIGKK